VHLQRVAFKAHCQLQCTCQCCTAQTQCLPCCLPPRQVGFPAGVLNVLPGYGPTAGAALSKHPKLDKVSAWHSSLAGCTAQAAQLAGCTGGSHELVIMLMLATGGTLVWLPPDVQLT
jgi:hypothetical protein